MVTWQYPVETVENRRTKHSREAYSQSQTNNTLLTGEKSKTQNTLQNFRIRVYMGNFEAKQLLKDKKFWFASFLIAWAAALQGHMMWLQRQDSFQKKFGTISQDNDSGERK